MITLSQSPADKNLSSNLIDDRWWSVEMGGSHSTVVVARIPIT